MKLACCNWAAHESPTACHLPVDIAAPDHDLAGLPVLLEAPAAADLGDGARLVALVAEGADLPWRSGSGNRSAALICDVSFGKDLSQVRTPHHGHPCAPPTAMSAIRLNPVKSYTAKLDL